MIPYNKTKLQDHTCSIHEAGAWYVSNLIAATQEPNSVIEFDLDTWSVPLHKNPWEYSTMYDFITHMRQVNESDLNYPVILSEEGVVLDGWHRIVKAIVINQRYVKAVRFKKNPEFSAFTLNS